MLGRVMKERQTGQECRQRGAWSKTERAQERRRRRQSRRAGGGPRLGGGRFSPERQLPGAPLARAPLPGVGAPVAGAPLAGAGAPLAGAPARASLAWASLARASLGARRLPGGDPDPDWVAVQGPEPESATGREGGTAAAGMVRNSSRVSGVAALRLPIPGFASVRTTCRPLGPA